MNFFQNILPVLMLVCFSFSVKAQFFFNENTFKLGKVFHLLQNYYVDTINTNRLTEKVIVEMLRQLDPHSAYIPKEEVKEMNEPLEGNFEGIGVTFNLLNDTIFVISPISGGPSEKVGIQPGDRIIKIEGENVAGVNISNKGVRSRLLGKKGTKVTIEVIRRGVPGLLEFTIVRDKIPIYSIDASFMINDSIGYIRLNRFSLTTIDEYIKAFRMLQGKNMKHLLLDLTGNGGGYLEVAVKLADQFLEDTKIIVYTQGEHAGKYEYKASREGNFEQGKLVVLIDEGSASASEIVAGAIQDWDRGVIVGRRSFGKGLVQRPFDLPDSSQLRLTIARYYTPSGRCIQKPYGAGFVDYAQDLNKRYEKGEYLSQDNIHLVDSLKYFTLKGKRTVYGGGGIMPDIFVPLDTSFVSDFYRKLLGKGLLNRFALEYTDVQRKNILTKYSDFASFNNGFFVDKELLDKLLLFAKKEKIEPKEKELEKSLEQISILLKAYIARDVWTNSEFYEVYNRKDPIVSKAVEILINPKVYDAVISKK